MPPVALTATHEFLGLAGNAQPPNAAFLNSLTGDAALRIANDHVLNSWLSGLAPQGAGFKRFTYRQFYYVFLEFVLFENIRLPVLLRPVWMGRFVRFLTAAGMPTTLQSSLHELRILAATWVPQLTDAQRTVTAADIIDITAAPAPTGWLHQLYTSMLVGANGAYAQVSQLACLIPSYFIEAGPTTAEFARAQRLLASAAGAATLTAAEQADEVALFLLQRASSDDANPKLIPFIQYSGIFAEIGRLKF